MKEIKIERIVISVGKRVFELTPEEARELKNKLQDLIGAPTVTYPVYIERPAPVWPQPPYVPTVTWYGTSDGTGSSNITLT